MGVINKSKIWFLEKTIKIANMWKKQYLQMGKALIIQYRVLSKYLRKNQGSVSSHIIHKISPKWIK